MRRNRLTPVAAAVLAATIAGYAATRPAADEPAARATRVTRVIDGDTLVLAGLGRARLIGIDTPEVFGAAECFGPEAAAFARRTLARRPVRYTPGRERHDRYGRALVYLWLNDGRSINALLLERGYARTLTIPPNDRYARAFRTEQDEARDGRRGLWARCE